MARYDQLKRKCAKRTKGAPDNFTEVQRSRMPPRCPDPGGGSGKSNNGGKAPTYEVGGLKTSPRGNRRPGSVPTMPIS